jgi:hypothetical protein
MISALEGKKCVGEAGRKAGRRKENAG